MGSLKGQVAVVTGGSRGIGRATALELARDGAAVVVGYLSSEEAARAVVDEIESAGGTALALGADVRDEDQVRRMMARVLETFERIDVLVCSAGVIRDGLAATMTLERWRTVLDASLTGSFLCVREVLPAMMRRRSGSIVLLSSVAARVGSRGHANYAAAKGGIDALVGALAVELAKRRIRVNAVAPGVILTDMSREVRELAEDEVLGRIPLGRYGEPEEVARAIRFLASPDSSYVTGEVLGVTGGMGA